MNEETLRPRAVNLDIALAVSAAVGVTAGVILSINMDEPVLVSLSGVPQKLALAASGGWLRIFISSFAGAGLLLLAAFLMGFCALAQPAELLLTAFRGLGLGVCVRGVYLGDGVFKSLAAFLPYAVLSTGVLVLGAKEAFRLSMRYLSLSVTAENRLGIKNEIRDYTVKFLILAVLLAVFAMGDALLAKLLCGA